MRIAVPREQQQGEARVALTPESVKKLVAAGAEIGVETGAGVHAGFPDADYQTAGASLMSRADLLPEADILACVNRPEPDDFAKLKQGAVDYRLSQAAGRARRAGADHRPQAYGICHGVGAALHARAIHGRALFHGHRCGL